MKSLAYYFPRMILLIFVTEQSKRYPKSHTIWGGSLYVCLLCILPYFYPYTSSLFAISCALKYQQFLDSLEIVLNIRLLFSETGIIHSLS